jgi:voltage-gated potassium channel
MALQARRRAPIRHEEAPQDAREWIIQALDVPMVLLSLVMLVLAVIELAAPLSPTAARRITLAQNVIWVLFVAEFAVSFSLAADKGRYLRRNWLVLLSLALPFLRVFRFARALRFLRTFRATRLLLLANRGINQIATFAAGSRILYLALITLVVNGVGAAGIFFLERDGPETRIRSFADGLWWALASFAQLSHDVVPATPEGRGWAVVIQIINLAVVGYLTAVIASYLVEKDRSRVEGARRSDAAAILDAPPCDDQELAQRIDRLIESLDRRERGLP